MNIRLDGEWRAVDTFDVAYKTRGGALNSAILNKTLKFLKKISAPKKTQDKQKPNAKMTTLTWVGTSGPDWNIAANWSPAVVPATGFSLIFPNVTQVISNNNVGNLTLVDITFDFAPYTITGSSVLTLNTIHDNGSNPLGNEIQSPIDLGVSGTIITVANANEFLTLTGAVTGTGVLQIAGPPTSLGGVLLTGLNNAGSVLVNGSFQMNNSTTNVGGYAVNGNYILAGPATHVQNSNVQIAAFALCALLGSQGPTFSTTNLAGGLLGGVGPIGTVSNFGTIQPGLSSPPGTSIFTVNSATLNSTSDLLVILNGTSPGTQYDRLSSQTGIQLNGALSVSTPLIGIPLATVFTIVTSAASPFITGTFTGLNNGALITAGGNTFQIRYTPTAVTLTTVNPATTTLDWNGSQTPAVWSNPLNWNPNEIPSTGFNLVFPATVGSLSPINDMTGLTLSNITISAPGYDISGSGFTVASITDAAPAGTTLENNITVDPGLGTTITAQGTAILRLTGVVSGSNTLTIAGPLSSVGTVSMNNTNSASATVINGTLTQDTGTSNSPTTVNGVYILRGPAVQNSNVVISAAGTATLTGTQNATFTVTNAGQVGGFGPVGTLNNTGLITPGVAGINPSGTSTFMVDGATLSGSSLLSIKLTGTIPNTQYDQLASLGNVAITNSGLLVSVIPPMTFITGTVFDIVTFVGALTGTFTGLPEGATFTSGGNTFRISYVNTPKTVTLTVITQPLQPPTYTKTFSPLFVGPGVTSTITFNITNPNGAPLTNVSFTDVLPNPLSVDPTSFNNSCNALVTTNQSFNTIFVNIATLAANGTCTITASVSSATCGEFVNNSGPISTNEAPLSQGATGTLTVLCPPTITKAFGMSTLSTGGQTTVTFTLSNPDNSAGSPPLTNVSFSDNLPTGLVVSNPNGFTSTCPTGFNFTAVPNTSLIGVSQLTLESGQFCTITFNVTATAASGSITNTTENITAQDPQGDTIIGGMASATITLQPAAADLSVSVSGPGWTCNKQRVTYLITVSNLGPGDATNVVLIDTLFAQSRIIRFTQLSGPTFTLVSANSSPVTATIAIFPSGSTSVFQLIACVSVDRCAISFTNTATITSVPLDSTTSNNSSTATTNVLPCCGRKHERESTRSKR